MLKVIREGTIFIPNYEDYDRVSWNHGAAVYPQLWPEEMAGEGAIYRKSIEDRKKWGGMLPSLNAIIEMGKHTSPPKDDVVSYQRWMCGVLAKLADENGWEVLAEFAVDGEPINTVYKIPCTTDHVAVSVRHKAPPPHPPKDEGITIDMFALAQHMGDMMPHSFKVSDDNPHWKKPATRHELQELVCSMLAADNDWEKVGRIKTFYRIK